MLYFLPATNSFHQIISKKAKITILSLFRHLKNSNIILVTYKYLVLSKGLDNCLPKGTFF